MQDCYRLALLSPSSFCGGRSTSRTVAHVCRCCRVDGQTQTQLQQPVAWRHCADPAPQRCSPDTALTVVAPAKCDNAGSAGAGRVELRVAPGSRRPLGREPLGGEEKRRRRQRENRRNATAKEEDGGKRRRRLRGEAGRRGGGGKGGRWREQERRRGQRGGRRTAAAKEEDEQKKRQRQRKEKRTAMAKEEGGWKRGRRRRKGRRTTAAAKREGGQGTRRGGGARQLQGRREEPRRQRGKAGRRDDDDKWGRRGQGPEAGPAPHGQHVFGVWQRGRHGARRGARGTAKRCYAGGCPGAHKRSQRIYLQLLFIRSLKTAETAN